MSRKLTMRHLVVAALFAGALGLSVECAQAADDSSAPAGDGGGFVGPDACISCHEHESRAAELRDTMHGKVDKQNWAGAHGCESCHGPGGAHVKGKGKTVGMLNPTELKSHEQSELCLKCHDGGEHENWQGGAHDGRNLSCLSCHAIHPKDGEVHEKLLIKRTTFETCTSCHLQKKAAVMRSSHMPLREKSMTCTSCHNAHGSIGPSQLRQLSVNENCYSCHAEKRSPMLWEHAPVKESCLNCHDPHGSLHPNLLNARLPRLCQQCHDEARHPTQPYDSSRSLRVTGQASSDGSFFPMERLINHSCANCHSNIHGSNHPAGVRFMR